MANVLSVYYTRNSYAVYPLNRTHYGKGFGYTVAYRAALEYALEIKGFILVVIGRGVACHIIVIVHVFDEPQINIPYFFVIAHSIVDYGTHNVFIGIVYALGSRAFYRKRSVAVLENIEKLI